MIIEILLGILLAILSVLAVAKIYPNKDHAFWRTGLIVAALIYVGFAVVGQSWEHLPLEVAGVAIYGLFVWLSKRYALFWLALGWLFHVAWDLFLPVHSYAAFVPSWYPGICLGFDLVIAAYIFWVYQKRSELSLG